MHEFPNGERHPIAYASRTLNEHEERYGQIDKEALEIKFGLKRFHLYLYGRHLQTDRRHYKRIISLWSDFLVLKQPFPCLLAAMRLQLWVIILSAFNYSIKLVPSKKNAVAACCQDCPCRQRPMTKIPHTMLKSG